MNYQDPTPKKSIDDQQIDFNFEKPIYQKSKIKDNILPHSIIREKSINESSLALMAYKQAHINFSLMNDYTCNQLNMCSSTFKKTIRELKEKGILQRKQKKVAQRCEEKLLLNKIMQNNDRYEIIQWSMMQEFLATGLGYKELATLIYILSFAPSFKIYPSIIMERFSIDERTAKKRLTNLLNHQFIFAYQEKKSKIKQVKNTVRKRNIFYSQYSDLNKNKTITQTAKNSPRLTTENSPPLTTNNNPLLETKTHNGTKNTLDHLPTGHTLSQSEECESLLFEIKEQDYKWIYEIKGISEIMVQASEGVSLEQTEHISDKSIQRGILEATNSNTHHSLLEIERLNGYRFILALFAHEIGYEIIESHSLLLDEISDLFNTPDKKLNGWGVIGKRIAGKYFSSSKAYYSSEFNWWQDYLDYKEKIINNTWDEDLAIAFPYEEQIVPLIEATYDISDENLAYEIHFAANDRTKKAMLTSQNLNGARLLIGAIMHSNNCEGFDQEPNISIEKAYNLFIGQINKIFQNKPSKKLFSYGLIGRQIFMQLHYDGGVHDQYSFENPDFETALVELEQTHPHSPIIKIINQIIELDVNEIFDPALASLEQITKLETLCFKDNWRAILKAVEHLIQRSMIDDIDYHQISSWSYLEGLISDELKAEYMEENNLQPGDVFCFHKSIDQM